MALAIAACTDGPKEQAERPSVDAGFVPEQALPLGLEDERVFGAQVGAPFRHLVTAQGGVVPIEWLLTDPGVPGLSWTAEGPRARALMGTPTADGTVDLSVQVDDQKGQTAQIRLTFPIYARLALEATELMNGIVNEPYEARIMASPGAGNHRFDTVGTLPPGIVMETEGAQARFRGTPTSTGTFAFELRVSDALGQSDQRTLQLSIRPPALRVEAPDPVRTIGCRAFEVPLVATGGAGRGYAWRLVDAGEDATIRGSRTATLTAIVEEGQHTLTVELEDAAGQSVRRALAIQAGPRDPRYAVAYVRSPRAVVHLIDLCHRRPRVIRSFEDRRPGSLPFVSFSEAPFRRWIYVAGALTSTAPATYRIPQTNPTGPLFAYGQGNYVTEQHIETSTGSYSFRQLPGARPFTSTVTSVLFVPAGASTVASTTRLFPDRADRGSTSDQIRVNPAGDALVQRWDNALLFATRTGTTWTFAGAVAGTVLPVGFEPGGRHFFAVRDDELLTIAVQPGRPIAIRHQQALGFTPTFPPVLEANGRRMIASAAAGRDRFAVYDVGPQGAAFLFEWTGLRSCARNNGFAPDAFRCLVTEDAPWKVYEWRYDGPSGEPREWSLPTPSPFVLSTMHAAVDEGYFMAEVLTTQQETVAWTLTPTVALHYLTGPVSFIDPFANISPNRQRVAIAGGELSSVELWIHDLAKLPKDSLLWQGPGDNLQSLWRQDGNVFLFGASQREPPATQWLDFAFDEEPRPRLLFEGTGALWNER